jgi:hypothetical protein
MTVSVYRVLFFGYIFLCISFLILIFIGSLRNPFPCPFAVFFVVSCSFFLRSYLGLVVYSPKYNPMFFYIFYQHFCSFFSFLPYFFRHITISSSVSLHCHRMCSGVSFALQNGQSGCGPIVTSSKSGYRHLIALFQPLSVFLPTRVLLSLFYCILPLFLPFLSAARHIRLNPSA